MKCWDKPKTANIFQKSWFQRLYLSKNLIFLITWFTMSKYYTFELIKINSFQSNKPYLFYNSGFFYCLRKQRIPLLKEIKMWKQWPYLVKHPFSWTAASPAPGRSACCLEVVLCLLKSPMAACWSSAIDRTSFHPFAMVLTHSGCSRMKDTVWNQRELGLPISATYLLWGSSNFSSIGSSISQNNTVVNKK